MAHYRSVGEVPRKRHTQFRRPDGGLYAGGTGEGGNWGESGKLRFGLQKLVPVNEDSFDMKEMRVVEGGFEIE